MCKLLSSIIVNGSVNLATWIQVIFKFHRIIIIVQLLPKSFYFQDLDCITDVIERWMSTEATKCFFNAT